MNDHLHNSPSPVLDPPHQPSIYIERPTPGQLGQARAHWVSRDTLLWDARFDDQVIFHLLYAPHGQFHSSTGEWQACEILLEINRQPLPADLMRRFPHLAHYQQLKIHPPDLERVPMMLKGQCAVTARDRQGKLLDATGLQIPGVLDDLYDYPGKLGVAFEKVAQPGNGKAVRVPILRLWAPTARKVNLLLYPDSHPRTHAQTLEMTYDPTGGVWSITGTPAWYGKYYRYQATVYHPAQQQVVSVTATDPYSVSLSMNSKRSQIIDLNDPELAPPGWSALRIPSRLPQDMVIYELHVRDFSAYAPDIPAAERGTYQAFTRLDSPGMRHLKELAETGLTHIHLLPVFDIATVNEDKSTWKPPDPVHLATYPPDSPLQQEQVAKTRNCDGYNWGYDPYHFNTPEGSYATNPDGARRVLEFRNMVQALGTVGLGVIMDMVYNHTHSAGLSDQSVLDKLVPGYYHRLNLNGGIEKSTCCQNTATEHRMMEKLMIDSLVLWATAYKVNGFRFDLMGHHMLENMQRVRAALDRLTLEQDGVDGKAIYLYGEGWDFGEVANNARGVNGAIRNIAGAGIGVFNDRLRDAIRGGGPFHGLQEQGFVTGLADSPNGASQGNSEETRARLGKYADIIRLSLAGCLKNYRFEYFYGRSVSGNELEYNGQPAGFAVQPQENVLYASAHDNETLFDAIQLKAGASVSLAERGRMQTLAHSLVLLGQGVPFILAGDEILRSKSLDRNSYNSGDWFNHLDYRLESNNFGSGLPPAWDNHAHWHTMAPILANPAIKPNKAEMETCLARFKEYLMIRQSSPLFRLRSAEQIKGRVSFTNTGPHQIPGVIVMNLADGMPERLDAVFQAITVIFNASRKEVTLVQPAAKGLSYRLHPQQARSVDSLVQMAQFDASSGAFTVPGRTTAIFVRYWD